MPMFEIERAEQGVRYTTLRVYADDKEAAQDLAWDQDVDPADQWFKQYDCDTTTTQLRDCDCDICGRLGAWACEIDEE